MKIGLFGQFGTGNSGNDGSLEAMLCMLRRNFPDAELVCICSRPEIVSEKFQIAAKPISNLKETRGLLRIVDQLFKHVPRRLVDFIQAILIMQGLDAVIIPGTGILDDFNEDAFGWPYVVFRWSLAARVGGAKLAFVSVGAGPAFHKMSRRFFGWAAFLAQFRSYRDNISYEFMKSINALPNPSIISADIVFSMPQAELQHASQSNGQIGIGVMAYRGWQKNGPNGEEIYQRYLAKMADFVEKVLVEGKQVRLLTGDRTDATAVEDLLKKIKVPANAHAIIAEPVAELVDLMQQIAHTDFVIASRYHNVVCALLMNKPTISLSYAEKNDVLLRDAGLAQFCNHIETFEPDDLLCQLGEIQRRRESLIDGIAQSVDRYRVRLFEQEETLKMTVLNPHNSRRH